MDAEQLRKQQREELRTVLTDLGIDLANFKDVDLDKMLDERYCTVSALRAATREGLTRAKLPQGIVDLILWRQAAAADLGAGSTRGAGVAAGQGVGEVAGAAAPAGQGAGSAAGAGAAAGPGPGSTSGAAAAADQGTGSTAGAGMSADPASASAGERKTVDIVQLEFRGGEERPVVTDVTFKDQNDLQVFLRNVKSPGLVRHTEQEEEVEEAKEAKDARVHLIWDISELENGKLYYVFYDRIHNAIASMRAEQTHLTKRRENEASQALLREVKSEEDETCVLDPELRILRNSEGRDEMEVDGVITCSKTNKVYVLSHKTQFDRASKVADIARKAREIMQKSSSEEYTGTTFEKFKGKDVVPAMMVENADSDANLRRAAQKHKVQLYRRNGSSISPWASMTPLKRAAARPAVLRWAV